MSEKELIDLYRKTYDDIVNYLVDGHEKQPKEYAEKLTEYLRPILDAIHKSINNKYETRNVSIKTAFIHLNSLHPKINKRLMLPWGIDLETFNKYNEEYYINGSAATLCLLPDTPNHLLTEIILRLRPRSREENGDSSKDWVGIILQNGHPQTKLLEQANKYYLCGVNWNADDPDKRLFSEQIRLKLQEWGKANEQHALIALREEYPPREFRLVTGRVFDWFKKYPNTENAFYLVDLVDSEQLAGIVAELDIKNGATIDDVDSLLRDCQWHINQYVLSPIMEIEKLYSAEGPSYPDAYFESSEIEGSRNYEMINGLIRLFTPYATSNPELEPSKRFNQRYDGYAFNNMDVIKKLFRKIRTHFEITRGLMGKYAVGYRKHAYEVACVVAGIMDALFYGEENDPSIEYIIRRSSPGFEGLDDKLKQEKVPFLFRQLFRGLSKEDHLFLIPMYREHFIHSFYVFAFGVALMAYSPDKLIPPSLQLKKFTDESEVKRFLKKWFMVSMWHDIAYMIEKGDMVLEAHILSLMREGRRQKGLLPWSPSLGNLIQVENLLDEIRGLSKGSIEMCPRLSNKIGHYKDRLPSDMVISAAFERRDHGVWSALMLNHAWDSQMDTLVLRNWSSADEERKMIAKAIIPHHLADWDVRPILEDYDYLKKKDILPDICAKEATIEKIIKGESLDCDTSKCLKRPLFVIPYEGNEMGYLLGICDMISQAGRENADIPKGIGSDLGIRYNLLEAHSSLEATKGSMGLRLEYTIGTNLRAVFRKRFIRPSLFLGLKSQSKQKEAIEITIGNGEGESMCFFNPLLE